MVGLRTECGAFKSPLATRANMGYCHGNCIHFFLMPEHTSQCTLLFMCSGSVGGRAWHQLYSIPYSVTVYLSKFTPRTMRATALLACPISSRDHGLHVRQLLPFAAAAERRLYYCLSHCPLSSMWSHSVHQLVPHKPFGQPPQTRFA